MFNVTRFPTVSTHKIMRTFLIVAVNNSRSAAAFRAVYGWFIAVHGITKSTGSASGIGPGPAFGLSQCQWRGYFFGPLLVIPILMFHRWSRLICWLHSAHIRRFRGSRIRHRWKNFTRRSIRLMVICPQIGFSR